MELEIVETSLLGPSFKAEYKDGKLFISGEGLTNGLDHEQAQALRLFLEEVVDMSDLD